MYIIVDNEFQMRYIKFGLSYDAFVRIFHGWKRFCSSRNSNITRNNYSPMTSRKTEDYVFERYCICHYMFEYKFQFEIDAKHILTPTTQHTTPTIENTMAKSSAIFF